ncbi:lytic transglycosylase domain-containing protein [Szabonella alba]|uniref:Lytic transglycosylase domain-containing protein n=1 Tax=Szabonella alba TaxID=2804194 RepID=A0A8K0VDA8_9RHOB|nr:lytic transglycosylase domain-containing protein [Szabonella alba]MBL4918073.1 lytic transglycosylase domain-containing protein [Szabonella alba]
MKTHSFRLSRALPLFSAILLTGLASFAVPAPLRADPAALRAAFEAASARDWDRALALAPQGVGRDLVEWQRLRAGEGLLGEYEDFIRRHPDWPGMDYLRRQGETAVARSNTPDRVLAWFAQGDAVTAEGTMAHIRALQALGRGDEAAAVARRAWVGLRLTAAEDSALLAQSGQALAIAHEARLDALLWAGEAAEAERMLPRVPAGWQALARARMALRADAPGVDALIEAVPAALRDHPGLAQERFTWRMRRQFWDGALDLLTERSASATGLGHPAEWGRRRIQLVRQLLSDGRPRDALRAATPHHLTSGGDFADLEFLAGWIALRHLNDPERALGHFRHLRDGVSTPISLSRGHYWEGRALEALGRADAAQAAYRAGAAHQTAYYGLLAAERLGLSLDPALAGGGQRVDWRQAGFAQGSVMQAARLLLQAGDRGLARRFLLHLAEGLDARGLEALGDYALEAGEPNFAVLIGKEAAGRGIILPRAYFPVPELVPDGLPVSRALALSIARRESEFAADVRSPAGALGLMQVMPGTAKLMSDKLGISHSVPRLTSDPPHNVRLGAAYLAQLVEEFGPSVALIASGYNAGPGRPRRWVTEFGDPRQSSVDMVDWVETIPFAETRTYVMRVVESLVIYRAKLRGSPGPVRVIAELRGG